MSFQLFKQMKMMVVYTVNIKLWIQQSREHQFCFKNIFYWCWLYIVLWTTVKVTWKDMKCNFRTIWNVVLIKLFSNVIVSPKQNNSHQNDTFSSFSGIYLCPICSM